jgi:signal transduction histidine kinase
MSLRQTTLRLAPREARGAGALPAPMGSEQSSLDQKRRLLLLVRTGLTLAVAYLLLFSNASPDTYSRRVILSLIYLASNGIIALLPVRVLSSAAFHAIVVLTDTAAISIFLYVLPESDTDLFVFYFAIILVAATSDRLVVSLVASLVVTLAYFGYLIVRHDFSVALQPALLLRIPLFLLAGTFYGFFADRVRRGQAAVDEAARRTKAVTEFLSLVTHDMKQPLWVAQQCAALLYDKLGRRAPDERPLIAQVVVNLRRMESLALNFLEFERLGSGSVRIAPRNVSLNQLLRDLFDTARPALDLRRLNVHFDLDPQLPLAFVDPLQLERGLTNIVDNALKYTPEGGVVFCRTATEGSWITVTIGDSGPGIKLEKVPQLFSRFQPGADSGQRHSTGLGLYIAREIMRAHGGDVTFDPYRRPGAWFVIHLPVAVEEERRHEETAAKPRPLAQADPSVA